MVCLLICHILVISACWYVISCLILPVDTPYLRDVCLLICQILVISACWYAISWWYLPVNIYLGDICHLLRYTLVISACWYAISWWYLPVDTPYHGNICLLICHILVRSVNYVDLVLVSHISVRWLFQATMSWHSAFSSASTLPLAAASSSVNIMITKKKSWT